MPETVATNQRIQFQKLVKSIGYTISLKFVNLFFEAESEQSILCWNCCCKNSEITKILTLNRLIDVYKCTHRCEAIKNKRIGWTKTKHKKGLFYEHHQSWNYNIKQICKMYENIDYKLYLNSKEEDDDTEDSEDIDVMSKLIDKKNNNKSKRYNDENINVSTTIYKETMEKYKKLTNTKKRSQSQAFLPSLASEYEPPFKKQKLEDTEDRNICYVHKEKLELEELIKSHRKMHCEIVDDLDRMDMTTWYDMIKQLKLNKECLVKMNMKISDETKEFEIRIKSQRNKLREQDTLRQNVNTLHSKLINIDEQIKELMMERKEIESALISQRNVLNMNEKQYMDSINYGLKYIEDGKLLLPIIQQIKERYNGEINRMKMKINIFENEWRNWNKQQIIFWLECIVSSNDFITENINDFMKNISLSINNINDLININDLSLKLLGIKNEKQRNIIIKNIQRLTGIIDKKITLFKANHPDSKSVAVKIEKSS